MLQHALEAIREAERHAASYAGDARRRAAELGDSTTREIKAMEEQAARETADRRKALLAQAETRGKDDAGRLVDDTARRIADLEAKASARMGMAVAEVIRRLIG